MKINNTPQGKAYLHIWRTGTAYERQNQMAYKEEWTNLKFSLLPFPPTDHVKPFDIRRPLPFNDNSFDVLYTNHVLEHLTLKEAERFVKELYRVLKPGSLCRIVVPDLESKCREYLQCLEACISDSSHGSIMRYRWAVMDLIDQMVREKPGGLMLEALKKGDFDPAQVKRTSGDVFNQYFPQDNKGDHLPAGDHFSRRRSIPSLQALFYGIRRRFKLWRIGKDPNKLRETDKWMHDRLSLKFLVEGAGFLDFTLKNHMDSGIENWQRYNFDKSNQGDYPLEPSVYIECKK